MTSIHFLKDAFAEHDALVKTAFAALAPSFERATALCAQSIAGGGKLLFFGNGGSAADAQHIATELMVRFQAERRPIAAIALTTDTSLLTACGNDLGFDYIFARQTEALARHGDVAFGISTSGRSRNVLLGIEAARRAGARTVGMTGADGDALAELCDVTFAVPSRTVARIQEIHMLIAHSLCAALEAAQAGAS